MGVTFPGMDALRAVLEVDARIAYALVFGSQARGTAGATSDFDIALGLCAGASLDALALGGLVSDVERVTGRRVDLVELDRAAPGLAYRIFRDGCLIFERDHAALAARRARAYLEYLDFQPTEALLARGILEAATRGRPTAPGR